MILQNLFKPEFIKIDIEAVEKDEAFKELVDFYCKTSRSGAYKEILNAIVSREEKMSTGIHKGVAVPHGKTDKVKEIQALVGISQKGINYDALDGEPVYILFMLITPLEDSDNYLRILKNIADLVENPQFQNEMRSQKDIQSVYKVICKYENLLDVKV